MAAPRYLPSDEILAGYVEQGMTHQQIVDRILKDTGVKVSRSSVSGAWSRAGMTNRVRYEDWLPWPKIKTEHNNSHVANMLRIGARLDRGLKVPARDMKKFEAWKKKILDSDAVVVYVYDSVDGWYYVKRNASDSGLVRPPK